MKKLMESIKNIFKPKLRTVDIDFSKYTNIDPESVNLKGSSIWDADLSGADLRGANLTDYYDLKLKGQDQ